MTRLISYSTAVNVHSPKSRYPKLKRFVNASACLCAYLLGFQLYKHFRFLSIAYKFADLSKDNFRSFFLRLVVCTHYGNGQWFLSLYFLICFKRMKITHTQNASAKKKPSLSFLKYFIRFKVTQFLQMFITTTAY